MLPLRWIQKYYISWIATQSGNEIRDPSHKLWSSANVVHVYINDAVTVYTATLRWRLASTFNMHGPCNYNVCGASIEHAGEEDTTDN